MKQSEIIESLREKSEQIEHAEIGLRIARKEKKELLAMLLGKKKGQKNVPKH